MLEKQIRNDRAVVNISAKTRLNIRFHNPNTPEATADYILKLCLKANQKRFEGILQEEASKDCDFPINHKGRCVG